MIRQRLRERDPVHLSPLGLWVLTRYDDCVTSLRDPRFGRDVGDTYGEIGLAAHWLKHILHHVFLYKAKARLGWALLPE